MTQPGAILYPQPGWWVRSNRVGVNTGLGYGWAVNAVGATHPQGSDTGTLSWACNAVGAHPPNPSFDTIGGATVGTGATQTLSHTAAAGADVFALVTTLVSETVSSATYNSVAMTVVGSIPLNNATTNGTLTLLRRAASGTGSAATVSVTKSGSAHGATANSISYANVHTVSTLITNFGTGTSATIADTCTSGQIILAGMGSNTPITGTVGTQRWHNTGTGVATGLLLESAVSATLAGTLTSSFWGALAVVLT